MSSLLASPDGTLPADSEGSVAFLFLLCFFSLFAATLDSCVSTDFGAGTIDAVSDDGAFLTGTKGVTENDSEVSTWRFRSSLVYRVMAQSAMCW